MGEAAAQPGVGGEDELGGELADGVGVPGLVVEDYLLEREAAFEARPHQRPQVAHVLDGDDKAVGGGLDGMELRQEARHRRKRRRFSLAAAAQGGGIFAAIVGSGDRDRGTPSVPEEEGMVMVSAAAMVAAIAAAAVVGDGEDVWYWISDFVAVE